MEESSFGRLLSVLWSPGATFESIRRRPTWAVALVALLVMATSVGVLVTQRLDMEGAIRDQMEARGQQLSDEEIERGAKIAKWVGSGFNIVIVPIGFLLIALCFLVLVNLLGGEIDFVGSLSTTLHGFVPYGVSLLLSIPVVLGRETISVESAQRGLLLSNLGALVSDDSSLPLIALLGCIDLFTIWTVCLLAIGFRITSGATRGAAAGAVVLLWGLWIAGRVGMAALGS